MRAWLGVLGLLMFACGGGGGKTSDDPTDTGTTAGTTTGTSTTGTTAADDTTTPTSTGELAGCACFELRIEGYVEVLCPQPVTCGALTSTCLDDETNCVPSSVPALDCMLAAILADTPGEVGWSQTITFSDENDFYTSDRTLRVFNFGTGQVFWTGDLYTGLTNETGGVRRFDLAALDLAACQAIAAAPARFDCLRAAFEAPPAEVCIEATPVF